MQTAQRERLLRREFPSSGRSPDAILDVFREEILAHAMGNGRPAIFWMGDFTSGTARNRGGTSKRSNES